MKRLAIVLVSFLVVVPANAASFNCAKASTNVEHLICDDPSLSTLDEQLAKAYRGALDKSNDKTKVAHEQREWLKGIRNACRDVACLRNAYEQRNLELSKLQAADSMTAGTGHALKEKPKGEFVLRAVSSSGGAYDDRGFCSAFTANLNESRYLDFNTCNPRLSPKFPRFSRPKWTEIPLDLGLVKRILTDRPTVGFKKWQEIYSAKLVAGEVKLWTINVDLLHDGKLDTLVKLDHGSDGKEPYCAPYDSKIMVTRIGDPKAAYWFSATNRFNSDYLGGDMIYDADTKRYFMLRWNRYSEAIGGGVTAPEIGASASVMVSEGGLRGVWPVCWIDWVQTGHRRGGKNKVIYVQ